MRYLRCFLFPDEHLLSSPSSSPLFSFSSPFSTASSALVKLDSKSSSVKKKEVLNKLWSAVYNEEKRVNIRLRKLRWFVFNACMTIRTNLPHHNEIEVGESYSLLNKRNSGSVNIGFTSLCTKEFSSLMNNKFRGTQNIDIQPALVNRGEYATSTNNKNCGINKNALPPCSLPSS